MSFDTKELADKAGRAAMQTMPDRGAGWTLEVWQNCGWHFSIKRGLASIYYCDVTRGGYHCLISDDPEHTGCGSCRWSKETTGFHDKPFAAFEAEKAKALAHFEEERALFIKLEKLLAAI